MVTAKPESLASLYLGDETAWLDSMAELVRLGRFDELDFDNLKEYLSDMARRDRREVESRLTLLLTHMLKWMHQPNRRSGGWQATIIAQRQELNSLLESRALRNHAESVLATAYLNSVERSAVETGLPAESLPAECPWELDALLAGDVLEGA